MGGKGTPGFGRVWRGVFTALFCAAVVVLAGWVFPAKWNTVMPAAMHMPERSFRLGLDLIGGAHLVYEADMSQVAQADQASALDGVRDVVERRVNAMGVSEATVAAVVSGDASRILVDLPGVSNVREAVNQIGETPVLTFAYPAPEVSPTPAVDSDAERAKAREQAEGILSRVQKGETLASLVSLSQGPQKDQEGLSGWVDEFDPRVQALPKGSVKGALIPKVVEKASSFAVVELADTRQANEWQFSEMTFCFAGVAGCDGATRTREEALALAQGIAKTVTADTFATVSDAQSDTPDGGSSRGWVRQNKLDINEAFALVKMQVNETRVTDVGGRVALILKQGARGYGEYQFREVEFLLPGAANAGGMAWQMSQLSGKHIKHATVEFDQQTSTPHVALTFNDDGAKLFGDLTKEYKGQRIAIFLDGEIISAPLVQQEILGGQAVITNVGSLPEAKMLAQRLRAGALPVPISLVSQQIIGPSLGAASLAESLRAAYVGLALVGVFMVLMYRLPGLVAVGALAVYTVLVLTVFKGLPVTLTLPGLAGFVLSIGIAVDANVLIFERMKEEWRAGKAPTQAVNDAFARAWTAIRDGNMTTIFSCVILYALTTGFIQGFALTLFVGVVVSMFSAITVTRWVMRALVRVRALRHPWLLGM